LRRASSLVCHRGYLLCSILLILLLTQALTGRDGRKKPGGDRDGSSRGGGEGSALRKDGFAHKLISRLVCGVFFSQPASPLARPVLMSPQATCVPTIGQFFAWCENRPTASRDPKPSSPPNTSTVARPSSALPSSSTMLVQNSMRLARGALLVRPRPQLPFPLSRSNAYLAHRELRCRRPPSLLS
jgi:hypothetical protein